MPTITKPSNHFQVVTATGANIKSACEAVFGDGLYVIKDRANSNNWQWIDYVRGTSAVLRSNTTAAETTYSAPSGNSVGFCWKANGAGVSNTAGSITSTVSANQTAGFSIVTWTAGGVGTTIGHGLGVVPTMIIVKDRSVSADWCVYTTTTGAGAFIKLNSTAASAADTTMWGNTTPASTTFKWGYSTGDSMVAYCFAEIPGYSKFGSYTGNGNADGPFVFCGFRPRYLMVKATTNISGNWDIVDTARDTYNVMTNGLYPNLSNTESTGHLVDATASGFKIRNNTTNMNNSGSATYIYAAFAEHPFGGSNCSPSPAR